MSTRYKSSLRGQPETNLNSNTIINESNRGKQQRQKEPSVKIQQTHNAKLQKNTQKDEKLNQKIKILIEKEEFEEDDIEEEKQPVDSVNRFQTSRPGQRNPQQLTSTMIDTYKDESQLTKVSAASNLSSKSTRKNRLDNRYNEINIKQEQKDHDIKQNEFQLITQNHSEIPSSKQSSQICENPFIQKLIFECPDLQPDNDDITIENEQNNESPTPQQPAKQYFTMELFDKNNDYREKIFKNYRTDIIQNSPIKQMQIQQFLTGENYPQLYNMEKRQIHINNSRIQYKVVILNNINSLKVDNNHNILMNLINADEIDDNQQNIFPPTLLKQQISCNCQKTQCNKLYCDCFNALQRCNDSCQCQDCKNKQQDHRQLAIKNIQTQNPHAFKSKIVELKENEDFSDSEQLVHNKGCNCQRSNCLKQYCECYNTGVRCSDQCKCVECKNLDQNTKLNNRMNLSTTYKQTSSEDHVIYSHNSMNNNLINNNNHNNPNIININNNILSNETLNTHPNALQNFVSPLTNNSYLQHLGSSTNISNNILNNPGMISSFKGGLESGGFNQYNPNKFRQDINYSGGYNNILNNLQFEENSNKFPNNNNNISNNHNNNNNISNIINNSNILTTNNQYQLFNAHEDIEEDQHFNNNPNQNGNNHYQEIGGIVNMHKNSFELGNILNSNPLGSSYIQFQDFVNNSNNFEGNKNMGSISIIKMEDRGNAKNKLINLGNSVGSFSNLSEFIEKPK